MLFSYEINLLSQRRFGVVSAETEESAKTIVARTENVDEAWVKLRDLPIESGKAVYIGMDCG